MTDPTTSPFWRALRSLMKSGLDKDSILFRDDMGEPVTASMVKESMEGDKKLATKFIQAADEAAVLSMIGRTKREPGGALRKLAEEAIEIADAHGWHVPEDAWEDKHQVPTLLALIHSEVSEALEAFRKGDFENFGEELADVQIRLLQYAFALGVDLDEEVRKKMKVNAQRPWKHGGKRI